MSIPQNFDNAQPVSGIPYPVVLNFKHLHPHDLGKFEMHDERAGGDLSHVDLEASDFNKVLLGGPQWKEVIHSEIRQACQNNLAENVRALKAKSRKREAVEVEKEGPVDPWRRTTGGPLREGILTVNKGWFGGSGHTIWDPEKVAAFTEAAMSFLKKHFPDGQLRFASAHADEEAYHIHFVVAVWQARYTANRGYQSLLKASANPLLANYEYAQDLAGEAFLELGIVRGERRAEMRRIAKAADTPVPEKRRHVPPSQWRREQIEQGRSLAQQIITTAKDQANAIVENARALSESAIRKSRSQTAKDAKESGARLIREKAEANRERDVLAPNIAQMQKETADAGEALAQAEVKLAAIHQETFEVAVAVAAAKDELKTVITLRADTVAQLGRIEHRISCAEATRESVEQDVRKTETRLSQITEQATELQRRTQIAEEGLKLIFRTAENEKSKAATARKEAHQADVRKRTAEAELAAAVLRRRAEEERLAAAQVSLFAARHEQSRAEAFATGLMEGLKLFVAGKINWQSGRSGEEPSLKWSDAVPSDPTLRKAIELRIAPAFSMLTNLAGIVSIAVQTLLASERQKLAEEAAFVVGLRDDWDVEQRSRLGRIETSGAGSDPEIE